MKKSTIQQEKRIQELENLHGISINESGIEENGTYRFTARVKRYYAYIEPDGSVLVGNLGLYPAIENLQKKNN